MKGLAVIVGDIGTGKTTLARRVLDELNEEHYEAALLVVLHSSVTTDWLMKKIAMQIEVKDPGIASVELLGQIYKRLLETAPTSRRGPHATCGGTGTWSSS